MLDPNYKNERVFSYLFTLFFLILGLFPLLHGNSVKLVFFFVAIIFLLVGLVLPRLFTLPNKLWIKLGQLLGIITTPIVLSIIYLISVIPISFILKLFGKDVIDEKINPEKKSYWIKRKEPPTDFDKQF